MPNRRLFRKRTNWEFVGENAHVFAAGLALAAAAFAWSGLFSGESPPASRFASAETDASNTQATAAATFAERPDVAEQRPSAAPMPAPIATLTPPHFAPLVPKVKPGLPPQVVGRSVASLHMRQPTQLIEHHTRVVRRAIRLAAAHILSARVVPVPRRRHKQPVMVAAAKRRLPPHLQSSLDEPYSAPGGRSPAEAALAPAPPNERADTSDALAAAQLPQPTAANSDAATNSEATISMPHRLGRSMPAVGAATP